MKTAAAARASLTAKIKQRVDDAIEGIEIQVDEALEQLKDSVTLDYRVGEIPGLKEELQALGYNVEHQDHYDGGYFRISW